MITHHPSHELLSSFVEGTLPASLSAAIAVHSELCEICAKNIKHMTESSANDVFLHEESVYSDIKPNPSTIKNQFESMISSITEDEMTYKEVKVDPLEIEIKGSIYQLPTALRSMSMSGWHKMGKLSRSRLNLNEGSIHSSLLHIDKNGSVPSHTHKGFELTLLLEGSFEDEMGTYEKGDFIWLTDKNTHRPFSKTGCLCYTVCDDALQFTQGLSKLLNPIGSFIY